MIIYRFRPDMVYDCAVEVADSKTIAPFHTFQAPPVAPAGHYVIMNNGWQVVPGNAPVYPPVENPEAAKETFNLMQKLARAEAYKEQADPLFFKVQRGEATKEEWLAKIEEIKSNLPYQV